LHTRISFWSTPYPNGYFLVCFATSRSRRRFPYLASILTNPKTSNESLANTISPKRTSGLLRNRKGINVFMTTFHTINIDIAATNRGSRTIDDAIPNVLDNAFAQHPLFESRFGRNGLIPVVLSSHLQNFSA